jgi:hypothetical protein
MQRFNASVLISGLAMAAGCGWGLPSEPKEQTTWGGVKYTAETRILTQSNSPQVQFTVVLTLQNTNRTSVTRTYLAACPVRIRLYRQANNQLVYDETRRACGSTTQVEITLNADERRDLSSGVRLPASVAGDSLAFATYIVKAVPTTEGDNVFEVNAGTVFLSPTGQ